MILKKIKVQNFRSFGNNINELEFDVDKGNLILLVGKNGNGKCVHPETEIDIELDLDNFTNDEIINLSDKTEMGKMIIEYIKENNPIRYGQIRIKQNNR